MYKPINRSSEEIIKDAREFLNYKNRISQEMMEKGSYGPDILLLYYSVPDTIDLLRSESETFQVLCDMNPSLLDMFQKYFLQLKEKYKKSLILPDRSSLKTLIDKAGQNSRVIYPKSNISFENKQDREQYIKDILTRLKDCVNLYYSAYHNKQINAELSNGEYIYLEFLERNLPHILGITKDQILSNPETKKVLNIPQGQMPNEKVFDSNGRYLGINKNNSISPITILEKIIADLEGNQYIIEEEFKRQVDREQAMKTSGPIASTQFEPQTQKELLPFDKIDLKTRAFMSDSPYEGVSTFVPLAPGEKLTAKNDWSDLAKISKSSLTSESNTKPADLENQEVKLNKGNDYIFTGYGMTDRKSSNQRVPMSLIVGSSEELDRYKKKFSGQKPHNIVSIDSPINGNSTIFSPQEQFDMYLSLLEDFGGSGGMDLVQLLDELKTFAYSYEERIANEIEKRKANFDNNNYGRKK